MSQTRVGQLADVRVGRGSYNLAILGVLLIAACSGDDDPALGQNDASTPETDSGVAMDSAMPTDASTQVSYAADVRPIFQRCVICHRPNSIIDLDLTNPFDVMHGVINRSNSWAEVH